MAIANLQNSIQNLESGRLIAIPTDTVYGIAAFLYDETAISRLYDLKKRSRNKALPVLVDSIDTCLSLVQNVPQSAYRLWDAFWPGPLTLILEKQTHISDLVTAGQSTLAVRMPNHFFCLELLKRVGPLAVTSANISGEQSLNTVAEIEAIFGMSLAFSVPNEEPFLGVSSSIVDVTRPNPLLLREGSLSFDQLRAVLPTLTQISIA